MSENERQQIILEWLQAKIDECYYQASRFDRAGQNGMAHKWENRSRIFEKMIAEERGDPINYWRGEVEYGERQLARWKEAVESGTP